MLSHVRTALRPGVGLRAVAVRGILLPVTAGITLISTRLTISQVGLVDFGFVSLIATLPLLLQFAGLGVGAAVVNAVASRGEPDPLPVISLATRWLAVSAVCCTGSAVVLGLWPGWSTILSIGQQSPSQVDLAVVGVIALFGVGLVTSIGSTVLMGVGRLEAAIMCQATVSPVALMGVLALGAFGAPDLAFALPSMFGTVVAGCLGVMVAQRLSGLEVLAAMRAGLRRTRPPARIAAEAGPMAVIQGVLPIGTQSDRLVLGWRSSPGQLAEYSMVAGFYAPAYSIVAAAGGTLWPRFAALRGSVESFALYRRSLLTFSFGGAALGTALALIANPLGRWVSGDPDGDFTWLGVCFGVLLLAQAAHLPGGMFLTDAAGLRAQAVMAVAMVILSVATGWALTPAFGAVGPVVASIASITVCQLVPSITLIVRASRKKGSQ